MKRYQECSLPVRLWRRRWYLAIPYYFCQAIPSMEPERDEFDDVGRRFRVQADGYDFAWALAVSQVHLEMNWMYDWDEIREDLSIK